MAQTLRMSSEGEAGGKLNWALGLSGAACAVGVVPGVAGVADTGAAVAAVAKTADAGVRDAAATGVTIGIVAAAVDADTGVRGAAFGALGGGGNPATVLPAKRS